MVSVFKICELNSLLSKCELHKKIIKAPEQIDIVNNHWQKAETNEWAMANGP